MVAHTQKATKYTSTFPAAKALIVPCSSADHGWFEKMIMEGERYGGFPEMGISDIPKWMTYKENSH